MTVSTINSRVEFTGDGVQTEFFFNFATYDEAWIVAFIDDASYSGITINVNVDQDNSPGGSVVFDVAPPAGSNVGIWRVVPINQLTDYPPYTRFPARDHEEGLDKLTMIAQQLNLGLVDLDIRVTVNEDEIVAVGDRVTDAEATLSDHENRITTNEDDIAALDGRLTTAEGDIVGLDGRLTTAEGNITAIDDRLTTAEGAIVGLDNRLTTTESDITALESASASASTDITALQSDKADKATQVVSGDTNMITIANPTLADDVTINPVVNVPNGLVQLGADGMIPSGLYVSGGGGGGGGDFFKDGSVAMTGELRFTKSAGDHINFSNYGRLSAGSGGVQLFGDSGNFSGYVYLTASGAQLAAGANRHKLNINGTMISGFNETDDYNWFETADASAGGFLVNNQLTGAGLERVLTESDLGGGGNLFTPEIIIESDVAAQFEAQVIFQDGTDQSQLGMIGFDGDDVLNINNVTGSNLELFGSHGVDGTPVLIATFNANGIGPGATKTTFQGYAHVNQSGSVSAGSPIAPFVVGLTSASHTQFGNNSIQGKADATNIGPLILNPLGGEVQAWNEEAGAAQRVLTIRDFTRIVELDPPSPLTVTAAYDGVHIFKTADVNNQNGQLFYLDDSSNSLFSFALTNKGTGAISFLQFTNAVVEYCNGVLEQIQPNDSVTVVKWRISGGTHYYQVYGNTTAP